MPSAASREQRRGRRMQSHQREKIEAAGQATTEKSQKAERTPWRALFFFTTRSNMPVLMAGLLSSVMAGAISPATAYVEGKLFQGFTSYATGHLSAHEFFHYEMKYIYYLLGVSGAACLLNFLEMTVWIAFGELQAKSSRDRLFHGLLKKDIAWYDLREHGIGALLPRIQAQIRELQLATSQPLGSTFAMLSTALLSLVQALYISWNLALVSLASTPIIMLACLWAGRSMGQNYAAQQNKLTEAQKFSSSAFLAIETVKCFNGQKIEQYKYVRKVAEAARYYQRIARANALQLSMFVLLSISMFIQGFYYGGVLIREGKESVANVLTTFLSAVGAFQALIGIVPALLFLEKGKIAGSTLRVIMAQVQNDNDAILLEGSVKPTRCYGDIDVRNLTFAYPSLPGQLALDNITMSIPGGEMTFLIGKSGSGKSTLGQLLMRFYRPRSGSVCLDGVPIEQLDLAWLRTNICLVEQTSTLFNETVHNNIAFGKRGHGKVSRRQVMEAVEFALLQSMVNDLPSGLHSVVGYKGGSMSGGQRQRMALARARLRDAPVLILDESTSALDKISRGLMVDAIRYWRTGKTTIVITHDISQIQADYYAFVLDRGRLVQEGYRNHMESVKDTPFQGFLPPEQRALTSPYDCRNGTAYESIKTRGSLLDAFSPRKSTLTSDPLLSQLQASEHKRDSTLFNMFQDRSPIIGVRAAAFDSPWMRLAASPADVRRASLNIDLPASWWNQKSVKAASDEPDGGRRLSQLLDGLIDRMGQNAANTRISTSGQRRRRRGILSLPDIDEETQPTATAPAEDKQQDDEAAVVHQKSYTQILATVWPSIDWPTRVILLFGGWGFTIHALGSPVFSYVLAKLLQTYTAPEGDPSKALRYAMVMLGLAVIDGAHTYLAHACMEYAGQQWVDSLRSKAIQRILDQPRAYFDREENVVSRLTGNLDRNAEEMRNLVGRFSGVVWTAIVMSSVAVVWAFVAQWKMTFISLVAAPYIFGVTKVYAGVNAKWESMSNSASEDAASVFTETFTNIKTVRALTLEGHFIAKYTKTTAYALNVGFRRAFLSGFFYGISDSAGNFAITMIFYVGARLVRSGTPVQHVVQVFTMLIFTIANLSIILVSIPQIGSTKDTSSRLLRLVNLPNDSHEHLGSARITTVEDIMFEDLQFSYPSQPDHMVLKGVDFQIKSGTSTAIVGGSGSGKSTIASILLNLYGTADIPACYQSNGDVSFSGRGINHIDTPSLRALVVPVSQSPTLFPATVAENVAYGLSASSPYTSDVAIAGAAAQAGIHDFIISLPQGYKTQIGDGGLGLSRGQAQRIALARALVRKPSVLVLDEVTSALDVESAKLVRETIDRLVKDAKTNMTVIIITHDRDMMEIADNVIVLDEGRIVEQGEFEVLSKKNGALATLLSGGEWTEAEE